MSATLTFEPPVRGGQRPSRGSWLRTLLRHRGILLLGMAALALFGAYAWLARYGLDLVDEGYFLHLSYRVSEGAIPYRDFDTYYTPGVFYLFAALLKVFGASVVPVRLLMAAVRAGTLVLMFALTRRVAPWQFALVPPLVFAAVDPVPILPEPHPAWFALLGTLFALDGITRHHGSGQRRWLVLAGASAGLAFAFKQNVGAFAALSIAGYVLLRHRRDRGQLMVALGALYLGGLALAATLLLRSSLDGPAAYVVWLPLMATLVLLPSILVTPFPAARGWTDGLRPLLAEGSLAAGGFVAITGFWLVPLTIALGPSHTPFALFLGSVNAGALDFPLDEPPAAVGVLAVAAVWAPIVLAHLPAGSWRKPSWRVVALAAAVPLVVGWVPTTQSPTEAYLAGDDLPPLLAMTEPQLGTLFVYLAGIAAWLGLLVALRRRQALAYRVVPWYLLTGAISSLAFYPRFDVLHALYAGAPMLTVGAWGLARVHRALVGHASAARKLVVYAALVLVPIAAVVPHVTWRVVSVFGGDAGPYAPLALDRAPVETREPDATDIGEVVRLIQSNTAPGQPIFAYPADPLFYFLADRPNPTRFDHLLPGALGPSDMVGVLEDLQAARPKFVVWDHLAVVYWQTDPANRPLSDYIWRCYNQVATYDWYLVLERNATCD